MGRIRNVFLAALLACIISFSTTASSQVITPAVPQLYNENQAATTVHKTLLRRHESTRTDVEDRGNFGTFMATITSKLSRFKKSAKLHVWLINGKSGDYVVNALKLGNNIETALENTKMEILWRYVELFNKFQPSKITAVGSLMTHYGDDVVLNALITAKQTRTQRVEDVVAKLRNELFKDWAMQYLPANDVFKLLNLRNDGYTALRNSKLEILSDYVTFLNRINFRKQSFVKVLVEIFGGEHQFLSVLAIAKRDSLTMKKAKELETALLREDADIMMKNLISERLKTFLTSMNLGDVDSHMSKLSRKYHNDDVSLIATLLAKYGDDVVARDLVFAKHYTGNSNIVTKLQTQHFETWLRNEKSATDVFELLNIKRTGNYGGVGSHQWEALDGYIKFINQKKISDDSLLGTLSKGYGGEGELAVLLTTAIRSDSLHRLEYDRATDLQTKLFQLWRDEGFNSMGVLSKKLGEVHVAPWIKNLVAKQFKEFSQK